MGKIFPCVAIFLGIAIYLAACSKAPEKLVVEQEPKASSTGEFTPGELVQALKDIKHTQSGDGRTQWELEAKGVQQTLDGPADLQGVKITYYADEGRVTVVTADAGRYETKTHDAELRGGVVVKTSDGAAFSTDSLRWDQAKGLLTGQGDVKITQGDSTIMAKGFELAPDDETITLFQVKGVIRQGEMKL